MKNSQIYNEHKAWRRILEIYKQDNALLKYQLSELVDNNEDEHFLQMAEHFQNKLLSKDETLNKLNGELQEFSENIKEVLHKNLLSENVINKHKLLHKHISQFEKEFLRLVKEFNEKMLQNT